MSVRLPVVLWVRLKAIAREHGISPSAAHRLMLYRGIAVTEREAALDAVTAPPEGGRKAM